MRAQTTGHTANDAAQSQMKETDQERPHELKLIGAGVGRTGTLSLMSALQTLGMSPLHMKNVVMDGVDSVDMWKDILERRVERAKKCPDTTEPLLSKAEWAKVLHKYDATLDFPVCMFYNELRVHYPGAKVILTTRDAESWYTSIRATIAAFHFDPVFSTFLGLVAFIFPTFSPLLELLKMTVWRAWALEDVGMGENIEGALGQRKLMMRVFNEHNEAVKRSFPDGDLLVFNAREGWAPLCKFLDVPIPDEPFPNINSTKNFPKTFQSAMPFYISACARRDGPWRLVGVLAVFCAVMYFLVLRSISGITGMSLF